MLTWGHNNTDRQALALSLSLSLARSLARSHGVSKGHTHDHFARGGKGGYGDEGTERASDGARGPEILVARLLGSLSVSRVGQ